MERMINARLMWSLESEGLLSEKQCGFRKNHNMLDHLVRFETFIRNAFVETKTKTKHVITIFFDLEKAYDTTWKHGILADLWDLGFRGNLPRFIQSFLSEHSFRISVGSTLSELHEQEMGVPQVSFLSPALFSIKINNIVKAVLKGTDYSLFVDDFALCVSGKTLNRVERAMQLCVNSVQKWVSENGFKFSTSKTVCIYFHQQYVFFQDPNILLGKTPIKVVKEAKFLGHIFYNKLTFKNHIQYLKTSCQKALDILRVVGHTGWGADRVVLLPFVSPLQIGLWMHCVRIGPSVGSETTGSYPPSGLANRVGCFPHISCSKSIDRSTWTVINYSPIKIVFKLCS